MNQFSTTLLVAFLAASVSQAAAQATPDPAGPRSLKELAILSNVLVHHYECTADLILANGQSRETKFNVQPLIKGEQGPTQTLQLQTDKLLASANGQMLSLEWTRNGRALTTVKTMIQDSPMRSYMMMAIDPNNPEQQAQVFCNAVTTAEAKPQTPGSK